VYILKINIFTFSNIASPFEMKVIGIPASVATEPIIGNRDEFPFLLAEIVKLEKGLILGLNFTQDYLNGQVLNMRTLPTIVWRKNNADIHEYEKSLRHNYRRRIQRVRKKFSNVKSVESDCSVFSQEHYSLYLQIMNKTTTRLETLSLECFKNLPSNFGLTTYYANDIMLCWHIICKDEPALFFFFGGMNYPLQSHYASYHNNLLGIVSHAFQNGYKEIDFGQTAEIAKINLGGELSERRMFLYHKNPVYFSIIRLFRKLISYEKNTPRHRVFRIN
jgi:hypothetical protein